MNINKQTFAELMAKYNGLSLRERGVIALLAFVVIFIGWDEIVWTSQSGIQQELQQKLVSKQTQVDALALQVKIIRVSQTQDPDVKEKQQLDQLKIIEARLDKQLQQTMHGLIKPSQMAVVLEAVLTRQTDLKLFRVANLPTEDLLTSNTSNGKTDKPIKPVGGVYKHGLQIEFQGSYLSVLAYLKALGELPWDFYWDELELNVKKYPQSRITITVHTLSLEEGWIGV